MDWSTLIGVVVGGTISLGTAYFLERRRDKAAAEREAKTVTEELRTAARLIRDELLDADAAVLAALHADEYPLRGALSLRQWNAYKAILAQWLSAKEWSIILAAIDRIKELNRDLDFIQGPRAATGVESETLTGHDAAITEATEVLGNLTGDPCRVAGRTPRGVGSGRARPK